MTDLSASTPEELVAEYKKLKDARQRLNTQSEQLTKQLTAIENKLIQYLVTTNQIGAKFTTGSINQIGDLATLTEASTPFSNPGDAILVSAPGSNISSTGNLLTNQNGSQFLGEFYSSQGTS